ncbi:hypothetical protein IEN85_21820 [Pelagicoccus sp. NFK12]|uniref:PBP domain-containing protein n=1 Tax=Pelagicoccus enzymogenes TaxID=2773457 RepID=A0A927FBW0_9BACT|nr:hypothetical protein [Pelagicoccus enzymogenes]MBD5782152.1 hypothetical protein [Pelagicoccus enzymogenes]
MKALIKSFVLACIASVSFSALQAAPAVVVNPDNTDAVDSETLTAYLIGKRKFWEGGSEVVIAVLKDDADANGALEQFTKMNDSRFKSHWQRLAFSGRGTMPKQFSDPAALVAFVKVNKGAIGLVSDSADLSGVKKVN